MEAIASVPWFTIVSEIGFTEKVVGFTVLLCGIHNRVIF